MAIKDGFIVKNGNRSGFPAVPTASAIPYDVNTNVKDKIDTKADTSAMESELAQYWKLGEGTQIPDNSDLDSYTTPGNYWHSATNVGTLSHIPENKAFRLTVLYDVREAAADYLEQIFNPIGSYKQWKRYSTAGTWSDWKVVENNIDEKANQAQMATVEASTTASKAYSAGEYLVLGGVLYKATTSIAQGATIVTSGAGKNADPTTVGGELNVINSNITYKSVALADAFTPDSGITIDTSTPTANKVFKNGNRAVVRFRATGDLTISSNGRVKIGTLAQAYRPKSFVTSTSCIINSDNVDQQTYKTASIQIGTSGNVYLVYDNATIGNSSYPWTTSDGFMFCYDIV